MNETEIENDLRKRLIIDLEYFNESLPERYAIAWHAYLAGLSEWKIISLGTHAKLVKLLPKISEPDPVNEILIGRE